MIFIREHQQPTRHTPGLQDVERSQTFSDREAVVELAVDDELRRGPLGQEPRRVPFLVALAILPERAAEVVDGEEKLLGRPLAQRAEDAVVADECLELAAQGVALDPVCVAVSVRSLVRHLLVEQPKKDREQEHLLIIYPP